MSENNKDYPPSVDPNNNNETTKIESEKEEPTIKEKEKKKEIKGFTDEPYSDSNWLSSLFFFWCFKLIKICGLTKIEFKHLGILNEKNDAHNYSNIFTYFWEEKGYKNKKSNALLKTILRASAPRLCFIFFLCLLASGTEYIMILLQKEMIDYFEAKENPSVQPFLKIPLQYICIAFIGFQILNIFLSTHQYMKQDMFGRKAGFELSCFIYHKILSASPSSFIQRATQGEIVNFIQIDANKLTWMIQSSTNAVIGPILIIAYIYLLFDFFGYAFFAGFGFMIICLFFNYLIYSKFRKLDEEMLHKKDERMKVTTETFENIKILKLYNWENEFKGKIYDKREEEMLKATSWFKWVVLNISLFWFCPVIVSISTIGIYQYLNDQFNIGTMLIGLAIFARLGDPLGDLPYTINRIIETVISLKRIEKYIRQPDRNDNNIIKGDYDLNGEFAIKIEHGDFTWGVKQRKENEKKEKEEKSEISKNSKNEEINKKVKDVNEPLIPEEESTNTNNNKYDIVLKDITLTIKPGEIVGIIGEVGSGKSSLFEAILNSLLLLNPEKCDGIHVNGKIGYVCQSPWIQNATIRDNILFFKEHNEKKYNEVLNISQLSYDLSNFEGGDLTEIGEKGVNLSGGQKVRVSLARVLYEDPDIYLFDDPISALDANIGKKIMKGCIVNYLKGKTRIVATHAIHYLKHMDKIIYLKEGSIAWTGTYIELLEQPFFDSLNKLSKLYKPRG